MTDLPFQEKDLQEMRRACIDQEASNRELFESLGFSSADLKDFLEDKSRFSEEVWQKMEKERQRIASKIERQQAELSLLKKKRGLLAHSHIKNHWIPVR
jgi:hypothetical protein